MKNYQAERSRSIFAVQLMLLIKFSTAAKMLRQAQHDGPACLFNFKSLVKSTSKTPQLWQQGLSDGFAFG